MIGKIEVIVQNVREWKISFGGGGALFLNCQLPFVARLISPIFLHKLNRLLPFLLLYEERETDGLSYEPLIKVCTASQLFYLFVEHDSHLATLTS
jgi:hypothetical protein